MHIYIVRDGRLYDIDYMYTRAAIYKHSYISRSAGIRMRVRMYTSQILSLLRRGRTQGRAHFTLFALHVLRTVPAHVGTDGVSALGAATCTVRDAVVGHSPHVALHAYVRRFDRRVVHSQLQPRARSEAGNATARRVTCYARATNSACKPRGSGDFKTRKRKTIGRTDSHRDRAETRRCAPEQRAAQ